ncbi:NAD(P)/FAD-dependent oxidoreductase [Solicola gregarius]|uniref:NAD(P)/FAD-dependent oxidoreductase n=1 Tax=Solicola gregarius TaxID=2908642 RepID=A0AA46YMJ0_9ACTN|nr:NAD(P)/FAD-dependent oxidoreductase [Solicola gregarius]UYM06674.1 NAD(P)/FAD-dependent oxidoreductase [Solicola gregarius]
MTDQRRHDVAIIGGGAAGLSAAVALARSLRSVVVVDAGEPRNAPAAGAHNVLGQDGIAPLELLAAGAREAESYGAEIRRGYAIAARRDADGFELDLADGTTIGARRLLLASGLVDELPEVPGVRELWGKSVVHCPYCHGWEVRGQRIGVIGTSPMSVHQALLFRQLSDDVTLFAHTMPPIDDETAERLAARDIRLVVGNVDRLRADGDHLNAVVVDGRDFPVDAAAVAPRFIARSDLYEQLGGTVTEHPMGVFIETEPMGRTPIAGVWAAGNASDLSAMVAASNGAGLGAAAAINADLVDEDAELAVRERAAIGA